MKKTSKTLLAILLVVLCRGAMAQGYLVPTDVSQQNFLPVFNFVLNSANLDFRTTSDKLDKTLFPIYGERSVYWDTHTGGFVYGDTIPMAYSFVSSNPYTAYDWKSKSLQSIQFKAEKDTVVIFGSKETINGTSITWESIYFKNIFESFLTEAPYSIVDEDGIINGALSSNKRLLIIPSFAKSGASATEPIDQLVMSHPGIGTQIKAFLKKGGMVYAEGTGGYLLEKLGVIDAGTFDFDHIVKAPSNSFLNIDPITSNNPIASAASANGNKIYAYDYPSVTSPNAETIIGSDKNVVAFELKGKNAFGGRIVCNLALPTVDGTVNATKGSHQLLWSMDAILYAFANPIDVSRSVFNQLKKEVTAGQNAVAVDAPDTFDIRIKVRNLSDIPVNDIRIQEDINPFFHFVGSSATHSITGQLLSLNGISLAPHSETEIVYQLCTPMPNDSTRKAVNRYLYQGTNNILLAQSTVDYTANDTYYAYSKSYAQAMLLFSAQIAIDADVNWKNFMGLDYQSFKVFAIMENKERTAAKNAEYVQYIPKDMPFYHVDHGLHVPILKMPGGEFVDVLRGSSDEKHPEFDMDHDGHPDVWLDTTSIYPKGYKITEELVYWKNPWKHQVLPTDTIFYEDINHDGKVAMSTKGDGVVDVEEPGDKIRAWKITWNMKDIPGYQSYDPYCSLEVWVDPPDLTAMAAGVGHAKGKLEKYPGMFYPFAQDIDHANLADSSWRNWMMKDTKGNAKWGQFIQQKRNNYFGYTFMDTTESHYKLLPTDSVYGSAPIPNMEFIAVMSMGGDEIDMNHYKPNSSPYSKINYQTIFNEYKSSPVRTAYAAYAPGPNPMQFEYLSNNYKIKDFNSGVALTELPQWGKAKITYDMDASTEYSYYWIRNFGTDVKYNDPSLKLDSIDGLGDGVFGYLVYDIPKGIGGYHISLPRKNNGQYDIDSIVSVDGKPFTKWIDNSNTRDSIQITEDEFQIHVFIPQLLIPPALCDKNKDGIDDWIDDRGDRFSTKTGFLPDAFPKGNGKDYIKFPGKPYRDNIYGIVDSGWYAGADRVMGDDSISKLGKTHIRINAIYEGAGKEGPIEVSKGGWLVCEEIFGGSPWVIFSHVMSSYAEGVNLQLTSTATPSMVKFGRDTCFIKHTIQDLGEPHWFDATFDPYLVSSSYDKATVTVYAGGKEPCSLISPTINMPAAIDPKVDQHTITLMPLVKDSSNRDLVGFPKQLTGSFLQVMVESNSGSDYDWRNIKLTPSLPLELGNSKVVFAYNACPRPLVPGDDIGIFRAGWRFNQPEGEVLVKMGNTMPFMQSGRKAYFMVLIQIDPNLKTGVYPIHFQLSADEYEYTGAKKGSVTYSLPDALFSICKKTPDGSVAEFAKFVIGQAQLGNLQVKNTAYFQSANDARWSVNDVNYTDFDKLTKKLPTSTKNGETIDLSRFSKFPTADTTGFFVLEKGTVVSTEAVHDKSINANNFTIPISDKETLSYSLNGSTGQSDYKMIKVTPIGPRVVISKAIATVNGKEHTDGKDDEKPDKDGKFDIKVAFDLTNMGNDVAQDVNVLAYTGKLYAVMQDSLPANAKMEKAGLKIAAGNIVPGEKKRIYVHYQPDLSNQLKNLSDPKAVVSNADIAFSSTIIKGVFGYNDPIPVLYGINEFKLNSITSDRTEYTAGDIAKLEIKASNLVLDAKNVKLGIYTVIKGDTTLIRSVNIADFAAGNQFDFKMDYVVRDSIYKMSFFTRIDDGKKFTEISKSNNDAHLTIAIAGPPNIIDTKNYPNPFQTQTKVSYTVTGKMKDIKIIVYSVIRQEIARFENCPMDLGENTFDVALPEQGATGVYILKVVGTDFDGKVHEYLGKILKQRD